MKVSSKKSKTNTSSKSNSRLSPQNSQNVDDNVMDDVEVVKKPSISKARKRRKNVKMKDNELTKSTSRTSGVIDSQDMKYAGNVNTPDASSLPNPPDQWLTKSTRSSSASKKKSQEQTGKSKSKSEPKAAVSYLQLYKQQQQNVSESKQSSSSKTQSKSFSSSSKSVLEPIKKSVSFADLNEEFTDAILILNVPSNTRAKSNRRRR